MKLLSSEDLASEVLSREELSSEALSSEVLSSEALSSELAICQFVDKWIWCCCSCKVSEVS